MYRIIYKTYSTEKSALNDLKKVSDKITNAEVIKRKSYYLLQLYKTESYDRAKKGIAHYWSLGLCCGLMRE